MRPFWKYLIVSKTLVKTNLTFYLFGGLGTDFHIWTSYPKIKKDPELRHCGLLGALNTLLVLSYSGGKDYDKKPYVS